MIPGPDISRRKASSGCAPQRVSSSWGARASEDDSLQDASLLEEVFTALHSRRQLGVTRSPSACRQWGSDPEWPSASENCYCFRWNFAVGKIYPPVPQYQGVRPGGEWPHLSWRSAPALKAPASGCPVYARSLARPVPLLPLGTGRVSFAPPLLAKSIRANP